LKPWSVGCAAVLLLAACSARTESHASSHVSGSTTSSVRSPSVTTTATAQSVSARPTGRPCSGGELSARYAGGGAGGQTFFGGIVVWNTSDQPCLLAGTVGFAAYYPDGSRDVKADHDVRYSRTVSIRMPASTSPFRDHVSLGDA
jgi:hypothetical protein